MKIFTCKDRLEDIMTCIYDAWSEALLIGHDQIQLKKEPVFQQTIFDEYIHVDFNIQQFNSSLPRRHMKSILTASHTKMCTDSMAKIILLKNYLSRYWHQTIYHKIKYNSKSMSL